MNVVLLVQLSNANLGAGMRPEGWISNIVMLIQETPVTTGEDGNVTLHHFMKISSREQMSHLWSVWSELCCGEEITKRASRYLMLGMSHNWLQYVSTLHEHARLKPPFKI
jgi:hypothetical protein